MPPKKRRAAKRRKPKSEKMKPDFTDDEIDAIENSMRRPRALGRTLLLSDETVAEIQKEVDEWAAAFGALIERAEAARESAEGHTDER